MGTFFEAGRDGPLREALAAEVGAWPGVAEKKMMGCACFWARGAMFAFVANGCVVLTRLTPEERAATRGEPFFTGAGRPPIRKWLQVRVGDPAEVRDLGPLLRRCYERALAAPPKPPKPPRVPKAPRAPRPSRASPPGRRLGRGGAGAGG